MDKKTKFKVDYVKAYHEYMAFSRGISMEQELTRRETTYRTLKTLQEHYELDHAL